ncbi:MAG TPA: serine/threonine-protein kinase [Chroococcales cyanobacterium]
MPNSGRLPRYRVFIPPDAKDLLVGTVVHDRYFVLSVLGYGGMSVVYEAKTREKRPKIVALKTLRLMGLNDEMLVKRFQREAELLSRLNHPRIVQVSDHGTTARGQPFFVMDYLTGVNLADRLKKEGYLDPHVVRDIFTQVCGAVDHAHRCGVVHRDLKPGNIMLMTVDGQRDYVKVVDFGIARFEEEAQRLTRLGEVWGSPIYMSPEQCMGAQLDARTDIYSIGIVMYEALTGEVPHFGKNYVDTMSKQIGEPARSMLEIRPELNIPAKLDQLVLKALNKDPDKRFQTMAEMRDELDQAVSRPMSVNRGTVPVLKSSLSSQNQTSGRAALREAERRRSKKAEMLNQFLTSALIVAMLLAVGIAFKRCLDTMHQKPDVSLPSERLPY